MLFAVLALAMVFYAWLGDQPLSSTAQPQVVIDRDGIALGFGRNRRFAWDEIEWVRLRRLALPAAAADRPRARRRSSRPTSGCRCGTSTTACGRSAACRPPSLVRDNGLDTRASAMLDAVRSFRPNLVRP